MHTAAFILLAILALVVIWGCTTPSNRKKPDPGPAKPKEPFKNWSSAFRRVSYGCGHKGPEDFEITYPDQGIARRYKHGGLCPDCVIMEAKTSSTMCACCGRMILVGSTVTARHDSVPLAHATEMNEIGNGYYVGCMDPKCNLACFPAAGTWTKLGFKANKKFEHSKTAPDNFPVT